MDDDDDDDDDDDFPAIVRRFISVTFDSRISSILAMIPKRASTLDSPSPSNSNNDDWTLEDSSSSSFFRRPPPTIVVLDAFVGIIADRTAIANCNGGNGDGSRSQVS